MKELTRTDEEIIAKWGQARALSNAVYSIYKDLRDQEESLQSIVSERLVHSYGINDAEMRKMVTKFKGMVNDYE